MPSRETEMLCGPAPWFMERFFFTQVVDPADRHAKAAPKSAYHVVQTSPAALPSAYR